MAGVQCWNKGESYTWSKDLTKKLDEN